VNLGVTGALAKRFSARALTMAAGTATGLLVAAVVIPPTTLGLWPVLFLASAALALTLPACATMLSESAGPEEQGRVMGGNQAMQVGAEALSGALAGVLAAVAVVLPLLTLGFVALLGVAVLVIAPAPRAAVTPAR
ncbi:MAG: MFS transporter, partial [Acetobacteraceae bacterium]